MNNKYWQNFGELNNTKKHNERVLVKEFNDDIIISELKKDTVEKSGTSRRDFLKYLGFATATAAIAASCKTAVKKSIPFLNKPENIIPGEASYYATTFQIDGEVLPILAKVRDGRPIKIEGNDLCVISKGGTSAKSQASVLSLYDTARLRNPLINNKTSYEKIDKIKIDKEITDKLSLLKGKIALVTPTISSITSKNIIEEFTKKYDAKHIQYDEISYSGILEANEKTFNKKAIPTFKLDKSDVIVGINADFLGTWLTPIELSKQWSKKRKLNLKELKLSKHYQIESILSITGANADERVIIKPSEESAIVAYLYSLISGQSVNTNLSNEIKKSINIIAKKLLENKQKSIVICGSNNTNVQVIVNAINQSLNSYGNTIDWTNINTNFQGIDSTFNNFIEELKNKKYEAVIFANGANPVYSYFQGEILKSEISKLEVSISLNSLLDETAQNCKYIIPDNHYLESWGDAQIKSGYYAFQQPTINPLFNTRNWQESLMVYSGNNTNYREYIRNFWVKKLGSSNNYEKALQDGIYVDEKEKTTATFNSKEVANSLLNLQQQKISDKTEVVFYQKISIGSGSMANNPWLQEMPDPITKATWDNYAVISLSMAKKLNIAVDDNYEVEIDKPLVKININNKEIELPILVIPGLHKDVIGIAVGYGRTDKIGKTVQGVGKNIYPFIAKHENNISYFNIVDSITNTGKTFPIAYTQTHNSYEGRNEVMKEFTFEEFAKNPDELVKERNEEFEKYKNGIKTEKDYVKDGTLYPHHENLGIKWGMSIDLNSCTGCGTCVVACNAENNISVVGKKQVAKSHEMHWMRIDRYFSGNPENPDVVFQPMICQHCDNAPCENVCPVAATNHSTEGLNQMTYNRCIGTRYCANNCPFKVRRFNWFDFNGADSFADNQKPLVEEGALDEVILDMNEDLTRLVLNPDVTVRARGVIEKCSFCVQRLQGAKIKAKKANRPLLDGEAKTACMQGCPTDAIVFGNVNDKNSEIFKLRNEDQKQRVFYVLEQIHVLSNVNYLAKIRNKESNLV